MVQACDWWSWTSGAVTPANSYVTIVFVVARRDDVIVTWPAGARLIAATSGRVSVRVAVALIRRTDVTVAAAVRSGGRGHEAIDGHKQWKLRDSSLQISRNATQFFVQLNNDKIYAEEPSDR